MANTLYERIGGAPAVEATVSLMYKKILDDEQLAPFFANTDVGKLARSQSAFVTFAFGGPNHYTGKSLKVVHKKARGEGLNESHFNRVAEHLSASMRELGVSEALITEAIAIVASTKEDILTD